MNAVSSNPNASVTAFAGALTILLVWAVGVAGLTMPAEVASAFTTIVAAIILWVGRIERARFTRGEGTSSAPVSNAPASS
jgi:Flp pilus assembly protein TadB